MSLVGYERTSERSGNTDTDSVHAVDGSGPVAVPGAENTGTIAPGTAAKDTETTRCIRNRASIRRRTIVAFLVTVLHPFQDVAMHVVEAKSVRSVLADWNRFIAVICF